MTLKKKRKRSLFASLIIVILCIASVFVGGYFLLDKVVVPKYFGEYGIHTMGEMMGMMKTLYTSPNENKLITNGFNELDKSSAEDKLKHVFPTLENSEDIDYNSIAEGVLKDGVHGPLTLEFSDKELASVIDEMLGLGLLEKKLPDLMYINTLKINILELTITPEELAEGINPDSANIHAIFKIDTTDVREQMATEMEISSFLVDMIIPDVIYITLNYSLELADDGWTYVDGDISVNGRTAQQSEILLNLLIDFIFPKEDKMDLNKLTNEFGNILQSGLEILGQAEYKENGIVITIE